MVYLDQKIDSDNLVDLFCGCGGSGGGLLDAADLLKRKLQGTFVNHWDKAIDIHDANHRDHWHVKEDLFLLDPASVFPAGAGCSLLWASPSCTHFSVARGASPVTEQGRSHAFSVTDWVKHLLPEAVICENVKEFRSFGPVIQKRRAKEPRKNELMWALASKPVKELPRGLNRRRGENEEQWTERLVDIGYTPHMMPDKKRAGEYFDKWIQEMGVLGYDSEHRILKSADYGDPTIRQRIFVYFVRRDSGKKIVWPEAYAEEAKPNVPKARPMDWITSRQIIDWDLKGSSVFTRKRKLADNTLRRLAIGLVKYGLKDFLVPQHAGYDKRNVRGVDEPASTLTANHRGEGLAQPMIDHIRGRGVVAGVDTPLVTVTAGGNHHALAEAFMFSLDQTGGKDKPNHGCYSVDSPLRTVVTKANASCIEYDLDELGKAFLHNCNVSGVDADRANTFLSFLVEELHRKGKIDAKPWVYVYYSNGSEGKDIDEPLPTVRTKAGHALVYPVIELDGKFLKIDLMYRMLTTLELQRAMGFPDDMEWAGANASDRVRAIGNSVSRGVSRALGLAWYSQEADVWPYVEHIYNKK